MANRVVTPNLFAPNPPNWSLVQLDANSSNAANAINDSSLGFVNGPLADTGSANNYQVACSYGTPSALNNGMTVFFTPANTNTGASTLTVSPLSSAPIVSTSSTALVGGELAAGTTIGVVYDGTQFRILNLPSPASIWSVRLRSQNVLGNSTFEIDQRNAGTQLTNPAGATFFNDRWTISRSGTYALNINALSVPSAGSEILIPGTNFNISRYFTRFTLTTSVALAAGDWLLLQQVLEGQQIREIFKDNFSLQILCRSTVANLKFGIGFRDPPTTGKSLNKLATLGATNVWTLLTFPNIPAFPSGNFTTNNGVEGLRFHICLGSGTTGITAANDTWQSSAAFGAVGQDSWPSQAVNSTFDIAYIGLEPGPVCTTPQDLDYDTNLLRCQRYYQKSYPLGTVAGSVLAAGVTGQAPVNATSIINTGLTFRRSMAKTPTVTLYNHSTGAANSMQDVATVNHAITSTGGATENTPFYQINSSALTSGVTGTCYFHWVGDTGW